VRRLRTVCWTPGDTWGPWRYDAELLTLTYRDARGSYEIDLEPVTNSRAALRWIAHVSTKAWVRREPAILYHFVRALEELGYVYRKDRQ
jgi:hypothetical protein